MVVLTVMLRRARPSSLGEWLRGKHSAWLRGNHTDGHSTQPEFPSYMSADQTTLPP